ncbi:MAG: sigma-70 family RNA polymerase sigma factor [Gemmataceae bacterium]
MSARHVDDIIRHLRRAAILSPDSAGSADGHLLNCFIADRDKAAFEALVRRHGPMVWGVCRRILFNFQDAEDAFQATFLVLIRKAESIVPREMTANWLYGTACKTALKMRSISAKRSAREKQVVKLPEPCVLRAERDNDWQAVLDNELCRLAANYRSAVVLCDLEGRTRKEAARLLGVPEGTLSARLDRARQTLAKRLARQGLALTGSALATAILHQSASAGAPTAVASATITAAIALISGHALTSGIVSAKVITLSEGVIQAMFLTKLKMAAAVVVAISLIGTAGFYGSAWVSAQDARQDNGPVAAEAANNQPESPQSVERRLANLEKQLARLLDEVKALKNEIKGKEGATHDKNLKGEAPGKEASAAKEEASMRIIELKHAKAAAANNILWKLFSSEDKPIRIVPDPRSNTLFISADARTMEEIKTVLSKIDVPDEKIDSGNTKR